MFCKYKLSVIIQLYSCKLQNHCYYDAVYEQYRLYSEAFTVRRVCLSSPAMKIRENT